MSGKRADRKRQQQTRHAPKSDRYVVEPSSASPPTALRHVNGESLLCMVPGDILLLDDDDSMRYTAEPIFCAVIACPRCGHQGFITSLQYSGAVPVICSSESCSCRFRIDHQSRLVYLPVN